MANGYEIPSLTGERVSLRPMEPQESALAHQWALESDPLGMTCRVPSLASVSDVLEARSKPEPSAQGTLGIVLRGTGTLVGRIRFFDLNHRNRSCEIGYLTAPSARGKGYAREAVAVLLAYLFDGLGLNKVYAQTGAFNAPSIRLLEALGFKKDAILREHHLLGGVLHDDLVFSTLAREWREGRGR